MDTGSDISARQAAQRLGTSVPRVTRAIERSGMRVRRGPNGRFRLTQRQFERLRGELGTDADVPGLSRTEGRVLAVLARSPRGLGSARAVAARAAVSPTAAGKAISRLERKGLVNRKRTWIAAGKAREVDLITANLTAPEWPELAPRLAAIEPPRPGRLARQRRVPHHLSHLFWNTTSSQLDVERAGGYIARRLIETGDLDGLAWGAENLDADAWRETTRARGLRPEQRALAHNPA
jgi:hypothetical protein